MTQARENGSKKPDRKTESKQVAHILSGCETQSRRDHVDHPVHYFVKFVGSVDGEAHSEEFKKFLHHCHPQEGDEKILRGRERKILVNRDLKGSLEKTGGKDGDHASKKR